MQNNNTARMERDLSFSQEDFQRFARLSSMPWETVAPKRVPASPTACCCSARCAG